MAHAVINGSRAFAVIEGAGQDDERIIFTGDFDECCSFENDTYDDDELEELAVDIVGVNSDGTLTTEY